jgi:hypothetical protein
MKDGQELGELVARAQALDEEITKGNAVSASQQQALEQLAADIEAYNAATGRFDISVAGAVFITPSSDDPAPEEPHSYGGQPIYVSRYRDPDAGCTCDPCPTFPPDAPEGYFCYLEESKSGCDRSCTIRVCSYKCIMTVPPIIARRRT